MEEYEFLHASNRYFLEGRSRWTRQWGYSLMNCVAVMIVFLPLVFLAFFDFGNGDPQSGISAMYRPFTVAASVVAGSVALACCARGLMRHGALCKRGQLLTGQVVSAEPELYNDAQGARITYRFADASGRECTGVAEGPTPSEHFVPGTALHILSDAQTGFHAVL